MSVRDWLMTLVVVLAVLPAWAGGPPSEPRIRIESGMHQAVINRIGVDAANRYLVTGSHDKTVRVWDLATGKLLRVLRPPIGEGDEGKVYAVAISPDGRTVAAGGFTGAPGAEKHVYVFDRATGQLISRLSGLPNVVNHLAYSPDGSRLVATLGGKSGIRVCRTTDYTLVGEDRDYGADSYGADFDRSGRLVTASDDGFVRLYDRSLRLVAKQKAPGGAQPFGVRFSPDGEKIAVGFTDSPKVNVLSGRDLSLLYEPETSDVKNGDLGIVAWSTDGSRLYAGGGYDVKGWTPVRVWSDGGRGRATGLPASKNTIMDLQALADGGVVFGSADPAFGAFDRQGRRTLFQGPPTADYRNNRKKFLVNEDGSTVQFGYEVFGQAPARFSLATRALDLSPASGAALAPPVTTAAGLEITDWQDTIVPKLNGRPLPLQQYETAHSLAIAPDGQRFLLGAAWSLRLFDRTGRQLWEVPVPGAVWAVNIAANGQVAVAACANGTIRWYRLRDGQRLLTLFPHADRKRWVLWTPRGYYDAAPGAEDLIGWHVNQTPDKEALFYPVSQFFEQFYRPDVVAEVLQSVETDTQVLARLGEKERVNMAQAIKLPPRVRILSPKPGEAFDKDELDIQVQAEDQGGGVDEIRLYHNGKAVGTDTRGIAVSAGSAGGAAKAFRVRLVDGANSFRAVALSQDRIESNPDEITIQLKAAGKPATLHLLLVGINEYKNPALNLNYALPDARGVQEFFTPTRAGLFKEVKRYELYDQAATKPAILAKLQELQQTAPQDVVVIYLAGHGDSIENVWYFVPWDITTPERERVMKTRGLSSAELKEQIDKIGAKKVLVLMDACKSGAAMVAFAGRGVEDRKALAQLARSTGVHVVAASTKDQLAAEVKDLGHGVFTYTLLEGLSGKADGTPRDGVVTVRELLTYAENRLPEVSEKYKQQAQYPVAESYGQDFPLATVR